MIRALGVSYSDRRVRTAHHKTISRQSGFTLLEMVMVVFIMGILATVSLSFVENEDGQRRYEESLFRMDLIGDALLKVTDYKSKQLLSGFIFDNGVLPPKDSGKIELYPLISRDITVGTGWAENVGNTWDEYEATSPIYKNDTLSVTLPDKYKIYKGYRGPYLHTGVDSSGEFRDGWGMEFTIDTSVSNSYQYTLQANSASGEVVRAKDTADWRIELASLQITVKNVSDCSPSCPDPKLGSNHKAAVLIYENKADTAENKWITYYFELDDLGVGGSRTSSTIGWMKEGVSVSGNSTIPVGIHPVIVIEEDVSGNTGTVLAYQLLTVFPRSSLPTVSLEVEL